MNALTILVVKTGLALTATVLAYLTIRLLENGAALCRKVCRLCAMSPKA